MSDSQDVLLRQLQQLKELRDSGALTQEGFERRAADLLSGSSEESRSSSSEEGGSAGPRDWSATPKPNEGSHRWEAKPTSGGAVPTTPVATVTVEVPANPGEPTVATSIAQEPVQPGTKAASQWSAPPRARGLSEPDVASAEQKVLRHGQSEDAPVVPKFEPLVTESEASDALESDSLSATSEAPALIDPVSTKEQRRWLRRGSKTAAPVEDQQAAAPVAGEPADDRGDQSANRQDRPVGDVAIAEVAAAAEPLPRPDLEVASISVSEAAPDSAAIEDVAAAAGIPTARPKERRSWWRREQGSPIEVQQATSSDDATSEQELRSRSEAGADPHSAVRIAEDPPGLEQPFQRDLRWRRQSFLPAKWDEVRQGDRKGSYWDSSSRVVPNPPEVDIEQDKGEDKTAKQRSTYWARNRRRD